MQMTEKEIIRSYKQALNKRKQIGVLADLNACPREYIVNILSAAGVYNKPGKKPAKKEDIPKVKRTVVKAVKSGGVSAMPEDAKKEMDENIRRQLEEIKTSVSEEDVRVSKEVAELLNENIDNIENSIKRMRKELFELETSIAKREEDYDRYMAFMKRVKVKGGDK